MFACNKIWKKQLLVDFFFNKLRWWAWTSGPQIKISHNKPPLSGDDLLSVLCRDSPEQPGSSRRLCKYANMLPVSERRTLTYPPITRSSFCVAQQPALVGRRYWFWARRAFREGPLGSRCGFYTDWASVTVITSMTWSYFTEPRTEILYKLRILDWSTLQA